MSSFPARPAKRVTLYFAAHDRVRHHSLLVELLRVARGCGVAGLTVFQGEEGFGGSGKMHRTGAFRADAPLAVVVVDTPERVKGLLEALQGELGQRFRELRVVVADVEIVDV